jgi:hypothetical protein
MSDIEIHEPVMIDRETNPGLPERAYERCTECYSPADAAIHSQPADAGVDYDTAAAAAVAN